MSLINAVCRSCDVTPDEAENLINEELEYLRDLGNEITMCDLDDMCRNLGVDLDYEFEIISRLAG